MMPARLIGRSADSESVRFWFESKVGSVRREIMFSAVGWEFDAAGWE